MKFIKKISMQGIVKKYGAINVFNNATCAFERGNSYAITGSSGAGKSTLLKMLIGIMSPSYGDVLFDSTTRSSLSASTFTTIKNYSFGIVLQDARLIIELTACENIAFSLMLQGVSYGYAIQQAEQLLSDLSMHEHARCYPFELSGGQQQRVALARAIIKRPSFLFADEPTGNLDFDSAQKVINLLISYSSLYDMGLIVCSHDHTLIERMSYIYCIQSGTLKLKDNRGFKKNVT